MKYFGSNIFLFGVLSSLLLLLPLQYLGIILSGLVLSWIKAANSLAGQFNKAMEASDEGDESEAAATA